MSDAAGYHANLRRGQALREAGRYQDACTYLSEAIQADPEQPQAYLEMALAQIEMLGKRKEALLAADRAVALAPNSAHFIGYKAFLQARSGDNKSALETSRQSLNIFPNCHIALLAECNAFTKLAKFPEAEASARRMLALNAEDVSALNLLAQSLRFQNKLVECREVVGQILAQVPNDSFGHANAGYEALKAGDHRRANQHFLQALRFDPNCDFARGGLLQSLRVRGLVYRIIFSILSGFGEHSQGLGRILGPACFLSGGILLAPILLFLIVAFTLYPLSNFFLLLDPAGRRSLVPRERRWALFTGWVACLLLLGLALAHWTDLYVLLGVYLALFALSVYIPQWADALRAWREDQLLKRQR